MTGPDHESHTAPRRSAGQAGDLNASAARALLSGAAVTRQAVEAEIAASLREGMAIRASDVVDAMIAHRYFQIVRWIDDHGIERLAMYRDLAGSAGIDEGSA